MKKISMFLILLLLTGVASAQGLRVEGTVTSSDDNLGIPGVAVLIKGTTTGVSTDMDGRYELTVPAGSVLVFSCIGMVSEERTVTEAGELNVVLNPDTQELSEIVVIGYGTQKKSVVTASIAKISADDLASTAPVRMDNALKGLASGVTVTSSSGQPGAAAQIRVRV